MGARFVAQNGRSDIIMAKKEEARLDKLRERRNGKLANEVADWQQANAELVLRAIAVVGYRGGAIRFGYTRDGGAYAIGIYLGGDHFTEYVRPSEDIDSYLDRLANDVADS